MRPASEAGWGDSRGRSWQRQCAPKSWGVEINHSSWLSGSAKCRECTKWAPRYHRSAGPPNQLHLRTHPETGLHQDHAIGWLPERKRVVTAPVSHQKRSQRDATNTIERVKSSGKSTPAIVVPPLITVWLEVRVLPGPPLIFFSPDFICFSRFSPAPGHQVRE
jgi:hypothetical protein